MLCDTRDAWTRNGRARQARHDDGAVLRGGGRRVKLVNSLRVRRAVRIAFNTDGMQYTAFAARYRWMGEGLVLRIVIWLGLWFL